jgi:predicted Zn-dependent peptidase
LATGISAFHYSPTEVGVFSISAELEPERLPAALDEIAKAVLALRSAGPTDADIERARALLLTQWGRRLETMDGRASALASAEALRDVALLDEEFAQLSAVTPADVQRVTEQYLLPDSVGAVAYLPDGREVISRSVRSPLPSGGRWWCARRQEPNRSRVCAG